MKIPRAGRLIKNAIALTISGGGTAVLGVAFWAVAAHRATEAVIGRTSAEVSIMILLASLAQLSFGSSFERFLPIAGDQTRRFVIRAYAACILLATGLSIGYVALGLGHRFLPTALGWRILFIAITALWTVFALQDSVLIGLRESRWVPVENILFSLAKLAVIPAAMAISASQGIFLSWTVPVILAIVFVNWYLFKKRMPLHEAQDPPTEKMPSWRELIVLTGAQYTMLIISIISSSLVTLIVIDRLGPVASAHYYLPSQISGGVAQMLGSLNRSFLVEASTERHALRQHARVALRAGVLVVLLSVGVGILAAPYILRIFGASYAANGTTLLRLLLLAIPAYAIATFYSSFAWLDRRVWWLTVYNLASNAAYFVALLLLIGHVGILSVGYANLIEATLLGIFFLPLLIKRYRAMSSDGVSIEANPEPIGDV